jgi:membrane-associated phospholipid phosphatase
MKWSQVASRALTGVVALGLALGTVGGGARPARAQLALPPTYLVDASFVPDLRPPPPAESEEAQAEVVEVLEMDVGRTEEQYWRVMYWDRDSAVGPWIRAELNAITDNGVNPVRAARALALMSAAMNDAVVVGGRVRDEVRRPSPCSTMPGLTALDYWCPEYSYPSDHAAVAGAASTVLAHLFPMDARRYEELAAEAATSRLWAGMSYRSDVDAGLELGRQVGKLAVARALADGSDALWDGKVPTGPGLWVPTPPKGLPLPMEPMAGTWRPWSLSSGDQFRPPPPPGPDSEQFRAEMREVYDVSHSLTVEQRQIAKFWADAKGTATPAGHWNTLALDLVRKYMLYTSEAAVVVAALNTAQADAFIATWDAKYAYWAVRPITVIQQEIDPAWKPYLETPFFPAYASGHSTTSGAAAEVLGHFFPKDATWLRDWADVAALSRLYAGIHTRSDNEAGLQLGRRVAGATLARVGEVRYRYD